MLGLCNNFAYVIMLSAAEDMLSVGSSSRTAPSKKTDDRCQNTLNRRHCLPLSLGSVLLANIIPSLLVKMLYPFAMHRIPFGARHLATVLLQISSFLMVAFSGSIAMSLIGVALASTGSGLGEVTFLSLTNYFPSRVVGAWSSGTGGAGIFGSFAYAALTDKYMLALKPRNALLCMLIIPFTFAFSYWKLLPLPANLHRVSLCRPSTYLVSYPTINRRKRDEESSDDEAAHLVGDSDAADHEVDHSFERPGCKDKMIMAKPLIIKYMIPLALVYFAEYFINQGLLEFLVFDCAHGFGIGQNGQYRWYQVLYQFGVFISRSSTAFIRLPSSVIPLIPILQVANAVFLLGDTLAQFIPHVVIVFITVFYEGLLGGAAYVNIYRLLHKSIPPGKREFSLGFVSMSDSFGIVCAGLLAIPAHNFICSIH